MGGLIQFGGKGKSGVVAATQAEHEQAATDGNNAIETKAVTPKGLYWWFEKLRTLPLNFTDVITFTKAMVITAFAGQAERVIVVDSTGKIVAAYFTASEFIAVPATLTSPGLPGQKAYAAPYLYYCVANSTWVRFLAEGSELGILEVYTAVPATLTSPGKPGNRAYDQSNSLMYECVAADKWIYYPVTNI